uniref:Ig-like domain-containing protein n=1 Tax=Dicentrarchus labrax TaxID=13489 RepID=A0A8P4KHP8_DICLA
MIEAAGHGQRVTLTCSTSCPLTDNTNYIWYLNSRPLTLPENQNKHLVLDPVSSQHAGSYSCAVKTHNNISSREKTLTVHSKTGKWTPAAAAGVGAVLLVIIPLTVFCWIRPQHRRWLKQPQSHKKPCLLQRTSVSSAGEGKSGPSCREHGCCQSSPVYMVYTQFFSVLLINTFSTESLFFLRL